MKKVSVAALVALSVVVAGVATAEARVNFNINVDVPAPVAPPPAVVYSAPPPAVVYPAPPPAVVYPAPPPAVVTTYPAPVVTGYPAPPQMVVEQPPQFIYSPELGAYVAVGTPYDMVYYDNGYYLYRGGYWYGSPSYMGPWSLATGRILPPGLRRYRYEQIRHFRDREYRVYLHDREHYRGRMYRPEVRQYERRGHMEEHRREHMEDHRGRWEDRR